MKKTTTALLTAMLAISFTATAAAQDTNQDSDVVVNVSQTVELDARPSTLDYGEGTGDSGVVPGENVTTSDRGFEHIDIENIGSVPIEMVHAKATMPTSQPFGNPSNAFNSGNFFTLSTETAQEEYSSVFSDGQIKGPKNMHYLNRVEYAENNPPEYLSTVDTSASGDGEITQVGGESSIFTATSTKVGRFKVGEAEYFWVLYSDGSTTGTGDNWLLRVGETPHTPDQLGTVDFRNDEDIDGSADYVQLNASEQSSSGSSGISRIGSFPLVSFDTSSDSNGFTGQSLLDGTSVVTSEVSSLANGTSRTYNLYVDGSNDRIIRSSFNIEQSTPGGGSTTDTHNNGGQQAIFRGTGESALEPSQNLPIDVGVQIPNGVDRTDITTGTVTIVATENSPFS